MKKFLISLGIGIATVIGLVAFNQVSASDAKVFHHNVATNNNDACLTPEEIAGIRQADGGYEKIAAYFGEDAVTFKKGFAKVTGMSDEDITHMDFWDGIDAYSFVAPDGKVMVQVALYKKDASGQECALPQSGQSAIDEWNSWVNASGLMPKASLLHSGFDPKKG